MILAKNPPNSSIPKEWFKIEGAQRQIAALERAAKQSYLAQEASEKKARNAKLFKRFLQLSAGPLCQCSPRRLCQGLGGCGVYGLRRLCDEAQFHRRGQVQGPGEGTGTRTGTSTRT